MRAHWLQIAGLFGGSALLASCATTPLDIGNADTKITPHQVVAKFDTVRARSIAWGGVIISSKNLATSTQLEVLAYPLDTNYRPRQSDAPVGRFLVIAQGYLETADYKEGRQITVIGTLSELREGKIGDTTYRYPVVSASRTHLWPTVAQEANEPRFHFGIGIGIHN